MLTSCPGCNSLISVDKKGENVCPKCGALIYVGDPLKDEENRLLLDTAPAEKPVDEEATPTVEEDEADEEQPITTLGRLEKPAGEGDGVAWDRVGELGFVEALFETSKDILTAPTKFFKDMLASSNRGFIPLYGVIFAVTGAFFKIFWFLYLFKKYRPLIEGMLPTELLKGVEIPSFGTLMVMIVFFPVVMIMFEAFILYLISFFLGAKSKLQSFYRMVGFVALVDIFHAIPFPFGTTIVFFWHAVLIVKGLKVLNSFSTGKALMVFVLYLVLYFFSFNFPALGGV